MSESLKFRGTDYVPARDEERLSTQHKRVRAAALAWPSGWFTMHELAAETNDPPASVERQVRYLRSPKFGGYVVEKRHLGGGTFEYKVVA